MCFPSTEPQQLGTFHRLWKPLAISNHISSVGSGSTSGFNNLYMTPRVSFMTSCVVDIPSRYVYESDFFDSRGKVSSWWIFVFFLKKMILSTSAWQPNEYKDVWVFCLSNELYLDQRSLKAFQMSLDLNVILMKKFLCQKIAFP